MPAMTIASTNSLRTAWPGIPDKLTMRIDEVMNALSCSDEHVRHLIEDGSLNAVDVRAKGMTKPAYRIMRESLINFIQKRKTIP